jgi:hypothetical protein
MNLKEIFKKEKPTYEREMRELLRENLNTISVDVFHLTDPLIALSPAKRREYLLTFNRAVIDKTLIQRLEYLINLQANMTLKNSKDGMLDTAGAMTMNGLSVFKDDVERLSNMFIKEEAERNKTPLSGPEALRL